MQANLKTVQSATQKALEQVQVVTPIAMKLYSRKVFTNPTKYGYCPYCVQRLKRAHLDYKAELKPLYILKYKVLYKVADNLGKIGFETVYQCPLCKEQNGKPRIITAADFEKAYCEEYADYRKRVIALDASSLQKAGFDANDML